jgi:2-haloacid dehalogenase
VAPKVAIFDVNGTISDMAPMTARFTDVGAPEHLAQTWFATVLRDGFALAASSASAPFAVIAKNNLRGLLKGFPLKDDLESAVTHVTSGFADLDVHPDIVEGVHALASLGLRLVTLSNGSAEVADRLLTHAGIRDQFESLLSVDDAGVWKPSPAAYAYAAAFCDLPACQLILVAVHPWDIHGANQAGLRTAWINRNADIYPAHFEQPGYTVTSLIGLAPAITRSP